MKKIIAVSLAMLLSLGMLFSFSACTDTTADNEEPTTVFNRMETVAEENVVSYLNTLIEKTNDAAPVINVNESFGINDAKALSKEDYKRYLNGEELVGNNALDTLGDTLGFVKTYLLNAFSAPVPEIKSVTAIDETDVAEIVNYNIYSARNWTSENVTNEEGETYAHEEDATKYEFDEDGNELTDQPVTNEDGEVQIYENGDMVSKSYVCDNKLNVTLSFYNKGEEESAAPVFADAQIIGKYFPNTVDKDYVLTELAKVNSAIEVSDYSVEYLDCTIFFTVDMETEQILTMRLVKNAFVTFDAEGAGSFADLEDFNIIFRFTDTVECTFDYAAQEDASAEASEEASEEVSADASEEASADASEAVSE